MPRTSDPTRFTSTNPHALSKSASGTATTIPINASPAPPNETPQQKVKRLREAARRAKLGQESSWDKVVSRGRIWADRAHRVTATGLIFASVIATSFALFSIGDMIIANRSKKAVWFAQQQEAYEHALAQAREAEASGTLTQDLALFLNKERAIEQAEEEKRNQGSMWQRMRTRVMGGLKMEEQAHAPSQPAQSSLDVGKKQVQDIGASVASSLRERSPVPATMAVENARNSDSQQPIQVVGGYLDQLAERTAQDISSRSRSWWNQLSGR